jgi:hypothetical protein
MCSVKREFRESSLGESRALLRGVKEFLPIISIFCDQFGGKKSMFKDLRGVSLSSREFRENRGVENRTFPKGVSEILLIFS